MSDDPSARRFDPAYRPRINPSFVPVAVTPDRVHVRAGPWSGPTITLTDDDGEGLLAELVDSLDGDRTIAELVERFDDEAAVHYVVGRLARRNVVYDARATTEPSTPTGTRTSTRRISDADLDQLTDTSALVIGDDPMATTVLRDLNAAGIDRIAAIAAGAESIDGAAPDDVERLPDDRLAEAIAAADIAAFVTSTPRPELAAEINRLANDADTPWIVGQVRGYDGLVGPSIVPGESSCYRCYRERRAANLPAIDGYRAFERAVVDGDGTPGPSIPTFERIVGSFVSIDLLNLLTYGFGYSVGRVVHFDFARLEIEPNEVLKLPRCPVCGSGPDEFDVDRQFTLDDMISELNRGGGD